MSAESTLSTFVAGDGDNLVLQDWPLPPGIPLRGVVVLVHGLGEHAGRHDALARWLNTQGFAVRGYDQYGHGESDGPRGGLSSDTRLLDDLADIIDSVRARMDAGTPLLLLGHSMGGLVAAHLVALGMRPVDGLILSSPALDPGLNPLQKLLLAVLPRIAPTLRVRNGLQAQYLSHKTTVVNAYLADPLVHDRISARLARFIATAGRQTLAQAPHWRVPTLLLYAGDERMLNPEGSRQFAARAPTDVLQAECFPALYHEIFNEQDNAPVWARLQAWLDTRF